MIVEATTEYEAAATYRSLHNLWTEYVTLTIAWVCPNTWKVEEA